MELFSSIISFIPKAFSVVIQVAIIAYFYYRWLRLMRNSGSIFAFSSFLVVVGILSALSFFTTWPVLHAICRYILLQMPLLLIVIFQNDIRRAFTSYALFFRNFFADNLPRQRDRSYDTLIEEVIKAICALTTLSPWRAYLESNYTMKNENTTKRDGDTIKSNLNVLGRNQHLSTKNTGALIALQGNDYCMSHITQSIKLDCLVNSMLLRTIFYVGTPLHDGGVVIDKHGRIIAAGCLFPQDNTFVSEGAAHTRHNAAMGLCHQMMDCMVIVVSEETGNVTVCLSNERKDTIVEVVQGPSRLKKMLRKHFKVEEPQETPRRSLRWLWRFIGGLNRR